MCMLPSLWQPLRSWWPPNDLRITSDIKFELSGLNYQCYYAWMTTKCHFFKIVLWTFVIHWPACSYLAAGKNCLAVATVPFKSRVLDKWALGRAIMSCCQDLILFCGGLWQKHVSSLVSNLRRLRQQLSQAISHRDNPNIMAAVSTSAWRGDKRNSMMMLM